MNSEVNTLQNLKISLEHDLSNPPHLLAVLEKHHDYLEESLSVLMSSTAYPDDKQLHLTRFLHVVNMHGFAEEETLYPVLMRSEVKEVRLQAYASQDEHNIAFHVADEIQEMGLEWQWSEEIDAKAKVMATLMKNHLKDEERLLFPLTKKHVDSTVLEKLTPIYLERCKEYLDQELAAPEPKPETPRVQSGFN